MEFFKIGVDGQRMEDNKRKKNDNGNNLKDVE